MGEHMLYRIFGLAIPAFVLFLSVPISGARAAPLNLQVSPKGAQSDLNKNALYAVQISCTARGGDLEQYVDKSAFIWKRYTTSHNIIISTQPPTKKPDNTDQLPANVVALAPIFIVDDKGAPLNNRAACDQSYLVRRADKLFLVPAVSLSTKYEAGVFFLLASKLLDVASSVVPLFLTGVPLGDVTKKITDVKKVEDPMKALLSTLNQETNVAPTTRLRVGTTIVTTDYSMVTVKVSQIASIVADPNQTFIDDLRKQIAGAPDKLTKADVPSACIAAAITLNTVGIKADADKAYALGFLALKSFSEKAPILGCLGTYYGPMAVTLDVLWDGVPPAVKVTQADLDATSSPAGPMGLQPEFKDVHNYLSNLMIALGQFARNAPASPGTTSPVRDAANGKLTSMLSGKVTLIDNTYAGTFGAAPRELNSADVASYFESKHYRRFGCFAETTDKTGKSDTGAVVIFLSFDAEPDANQVSIKKGIALHPIFSGGKIRQASMSDNVDWIDAVLKDRDKAFDCNGLQIKADNVAKAAPPSSE
jgi:hypothetical protein